jgi:hypothetical protein
MSSDWWLIQKLFKSIVCSQQCFHFVAQILVTGASVLQKRVAFLKRNLNRLSENNYVAVSFIFHGSTLFSRPRLNRGQPFADNSEISSQKGQVDELKDD